MGYGTTTPKSVLSAVQWDIYTAFCVWCGIVALQLGNVLESVQNSAGDSSKLCLQRNSGALPLHKNLQYLQNWKLIYSGGHIVQKFVLAVLHNVLPFVHTDYRFTRHPYWVNGRQGPPPGLLPQLDFVPGPGFNNLLNTSAVIVIKVDTLQAIAS